MDVPEPDIVYCVDGTKWHETILRYMPLAARSGFNYGWKNRRHIEECISEAYYILTWTTLKLTKTVNDGNFDMERYLRRYIYINLKRYFEYRTMPTIESLLGWNWQEDFSELIAYIPIDVALREYIEALTDTPIDLAILTMKVDGYDAKEISEKLDLDILRVRRVLNRIEYRLELGEHYTK